MKRKVKKCFLSLLMCILTITSIQPILVKANTSPPPEEIQYTPKVLLKEITERTTAIPVYVYEDTTLYIKNGTHTVYKKFYKEEGLKKVKIAKQKAGSKLKFYLVADISGKRGKIITRKVVKLPAISTETLDDKIQKPKVQKTITNKTTKVNVTAAKGTKLVIKNDKKTLKTVKFKKSEKKKITIPAQKEGNLYFYLKKGNSRSKIVTRTIKDVIAPEAPRVKIDSSYVFYVKGEVGTKIYFKGEDNWWTEVGVILDNDWQFIMLPYSDEAEYYKVYLKDMAGNKSKVVKVKNPDAGMSCEVYY
ncbi:MAG: hypothetical protein HFH41_07750 [Lachnospiraceae bacterium]|nr:hypothetical protein [Lachnospiraceae bacterium]